MTDAALDDALDALGLFVMGAAEGHVLIGAGAGMWPVFTASPEYQDGARDPLDRWSKRVIGGLAKPRGWSAVFPSDGPPYAPFIAWAKATGRFWDSPAGMMVHDTAGMMISIRGAFVTGAAYRAETGLDDFASPATPSASRTTPAPCGTCTAQPCATACPVSALSAKDGYDLPACRAYLGTEAGRDCLDHGCKARRACPVSQSFARDPAQSAFHMRAFHPT